MKNHFGLWIGIVYFLIVMGPNVLAENQSAQNSAFDPIKDQMKSIIEDNTALIKQNKALKVQLIGLQLEVERREKEIRNLDPSFINKMQYLREGHQSPSTLSTNGEELKDSALIKEAQELFLSGQYIDLDEEQRLRELQLYDLQYQKQELELDLQEKQALHRNIEEQRHQELQAVEREVEESAKEEENIRRKVTEAQRKVMAYPQDIDLLKMENETLRKKISHLRKLLSQ